MNDKKTLVNEVGDIFRRLRYLLDWSQARLAKEIGISSQTVWRVEQGKRELRLTTWQFKRLMAIMIDCGMGFEDLPDEPDSPYFVELED